MKQSTTPKRRRRKAHRFAWFRKLTGELLGVSLGLSHRYYGSDLAGDRVVRILRAKVDRKRRQVVMIVARLCSGMEERNGGFNGPKVVIEDRREFTGGLCRGIVHANRYIPIDDYYAALLSPQLAPSASSSAAKGEHPNAGHRRRDRPPGHHASSGAGLEPVVVNGTSNPWGTKGPKGPIATSRGDCGTRKADFRSAPVAAPAHAGAEAQFYLFDVPTVAAGS